jgi:hypothetical protein
VVAVVAVQHMLMILLYFQVNHTLLTLVGVLVTVLEYQQADKVVLLKVELLFFMLMVVAKEPTVLIKVLQAAVTDIHLV